MPQTMLITGANRGIGLAHAELARQGGGQIPSSRSSEFFIERHPIF